MEEPARCGLSDRKTTGNYAMGFSNVASLLNFVQEAIGSVHVSLRERLQSLPSLDVKLIDIFLEISCRSNLRESDIDRLRKSADSSFRAVRPKQSYDPSPIHRHNAVIIEYLGKRRPPVFADSLAGA